MKCFLLSEKEKVLDLIRKKHHAKVAKRSPKRTYFLSVKLYVKEKEISASFAAVPQSAKVTTTMSVISA